MIMNFDKQVSRILEICGSEDISPEATMALTMECFKIFDKGVGFGQDRAIHIVQRMAINPQPIVNEIRRPIR